MPATDVVALPQVPAGPTSFGNSLLLDGTLNQYVEVPDTAALTPVSQMTIEAWVRSSSAGCQTIVGKNWQNSYWLGICNNRIRFYSGGNGTSQDGATDIAANVWTHIAVVWDSVSGYRRYFINGDIDYTSFTAGLSPAANGNSLYIGYDPSSCCSLTGNIAEVRLWNVARAQADIKRTMHVALNEPRPGLAAVWHLADDYNDSVAGHSGTPRNGANLGGPQAPPRPALVPIDSDFGLLPLPRDNAGTAYIPQTNRALLIGGRVSYSSSSAVTRVDVSTGAATNIGAMPVALVSPEAAYVPANDTAYVFGGAANTIYAVNPNTGVARTLSAALPVAIYDGAAIYHPKLGKIYVIGGAISPSTISMFDPATESVTPLTVTLPGGRYRFGAAYSPLTNKIYIFGGEDGSGPVSSTLELTIQDDGVSGAVSIVPGVVLPVANIRLSAVEDPVSHLIYLIGGTDSQRVMSFDPATGSLWQTPIQLPAMQTDASVVYDARNRQAVVFGGSLGVGRNIWRIPLGDGPQIALGRWDFPQPVYAQPTAIKGRGTTVLVGTLNNGLYRYNSTGGSTYWAPAQLGVANTIVRDVGYNPLNDAIWVATNNAGGKLITPTVTTYAAAELGTTQTASVAFFPGYNGVAGAPFFGTVGNGLNWQIYSTLLNNYFWRTDFPGTTVSALTFRGPYDLWGVAGNSIARLTWTRPQPQTSATVIAATFPSACNSLVNPVDLAFDRNGDLWAVAPNTIVLDAQRANAPAGLAGQGVCQLIDPTGAQNSQIRTPSIGAAATSVDVDSDGRVWVSVKSQTISGESGGLVAYQNLSGAVSTAESNWLTAPVGSKSVVLTSPPMYDSSIQVVGAADERVWAGKPDGSLVTVAPRWQQFDEVSGLVNQQVNGVWTVRGRLFLATSYGGTHSLYVLAPDGLTWDVRDMTSTPVQAVLGDSAGRIWVGTTNGLRLYTQAGWDMLADVVGDAPAGSINALAQDQNGRIWIGGVNGLTLFDRGRFVFTLTSGVAGLPDTTVQSLLVDADNHLWAGTANAGLARLRDDQTFQVFNTTNGLPANYVFSLAQSADGRVAASTQGGAISFFNGTTGFYSETVPATGTYIPLTVDEQGRLWAGGAVRNSGGWMGYYVTNSGLASSVVSANAADGAGNIWFGHAPGSGVSMRGSNLPPLGTILPTINGLTPNSGSAGTIITITGTGFSNNTGDLNVVIGDAPATVLSASSTAIVVQINGNTTSGDVSVNSRGQRATYTGSSGNHAFCAIPVIDSFTPTGGNNGVPISVFGTNFDPDGGRVALGGPLRLPDRSLPTEMDVDVNAQNGDVNGALMVRNTTSGCPGFLAVAGTQFNFFNLTLSTIQLNQGMASYGLMTNRSMLISNYVARSQAMRTTDAIQVDSIEVDFSDGAGNQTTRTLPYAAGVPTSLGAPAAALLIDTINSLNVQATPSTAGFTSGNLTTTVTLRRNRQIVASANRTDSYQPNRLMYAMLVPIMQSGFTASDLRNMEAVVNSNLDDLRHRIMPTGNVDFIWSQPVDHGPGWATIGSGTELNAAGHRMDLLRRQWNETHPDSQALIAFGIVDTRIVTGSASGLAMWPNISEFVNQLLINPIDSACDVGNLGLQFLSLGLVGSSDGCHLEIPLYVGWAAGDSQSSGTFGHEFGHIMGLVQPFSPNGSLFDNLSHSVNDELDNGECITVTSTYQVSKTLYVQPGVTEPIVNPLTGRQFRAQLYVQDDGNPAGRRTIRGKAIMSYACERWNENVFFEPVDVGPVISQFGLSTYQTFFHDMRLTGGLPRRPMAAMQPIGPRTPTPIVIPGTRLYVSGLVSRTVDSGKLVHVEVLGQNAPLSTQYAAGYWLVQRSVTGTELSRTGIFPSFSATDNGPVASPDTVTGDSGFFAATVLRATGVVTLELRKGNMVLDSFSAGSAIPVVNVKSPNGGTYSSGVVSVKWTASDANSDPLSIKIEYSPDSKTWQTVALSSGTNGGADLPIYLLGGSAAARVRVTASDGFHSGAFTTTTFTVSGQPPRPYVSKPTTQTTALEGRQVSLSGGADDDQDGAVLGANLRWSDSRDGYLGTGDALSPILSVGAHTLTLQATNSLGLTATASVTLTVLGDYTGVGIPDSRKLYGSITLNPLSVADAYGDPDNDGLPTVMEILRGTNPHLADIDKDGRNDAIELVQGTNPNVSDAPLPPDALAVYPARLTYTVDLSLDTPLPQQFVQVTSRQTVSWALSSNVNWLASSAVNGATVSAPTILVDAFLLEDGVHTGVLTFTSSALNSVVQVPVTVTVTNSLSYCDTNRDGQTNGLDVQGVLARLGETNTKGPFDYHYDLDRNGAIDGRDVQLVTTCALAHVTYMPVVQR